LLKKLAVPDAEADRIVATLAHDPVRSWLLQRAAQLLTARLDAGHGSPTDLAYRGWAGLPTWRRRTGRWTYAHLYLAATPAIRRWHTSHGIDDSISWATLGDLGRHIDRDGIDDPRWLVHHFRGRLFQLGRLQFLRAPVLEIHVPAGGPLLPEAVDDSFAEARAFFAAHFPDQNNRYGVMTSWMLDPQLADHLPPESNILAFQRRFVLKPGWRRNGDRAIVEALRREPGTTALERAAAAHRQAGRHWTIRRGWCRL
jgi:hypothetical protein